MILFTEVTELTIFGQLKIPMKFSINLNLKTFRLLNCLHMIFLHCIQRIKHKLIDLINRTFIRENTQYLACNEECAFSVLEYTIITIYGRVKKFVMLLFIFRIIFLLDLSRLDITGIPMGTNCAPLVADLFLFCYETDFMKSLSRENQADIIEAFN